MKYIIKYFLLIIGIFVIIFPNSFLLQTAALISILSLLIFFTTDNLINIKILASWIILSVIFTIFILISSLNFELTIETLLKYIYFPFTWIIIFSYIKKTYESNQIIKYLIFCYLISNLSVIFFYFSMLNGYNVINYFIENPNIDQNYLVGLRLHVYGSLIFFSPSIFFILSYIKNIVLKTLFLILAISVAIISGRTALLVALAFGLLSIFRYINIKKANLLKYVLFLTSLSFFCFLFYNYFNDNVELNLVEYIMDEHIQKIKENSGEERELQVKEMIQNIFHSPFGIGFTELKIQRNDTKPYNYEVLILATIMRFGIITFILIGISILPVILRLKKSVIQKSDYFYIFGFIFIVFASLTNPYLESFCFQWMFFGPLIMIYE